MRRRLRHLWCRLSGYGVRRETVVWLRGPESGVPASEEGYTRTWCDRCGLRLR